MTRTNKLFCVIFAVFALFSESVFALDICVPDDYATIQQGIDAAEDGDTVLVSPGTYYCEERGINFLGKAITVRSYDPDYEGSLAGIYGARIVFPLQNPDQVSGNPRGIIFENGEGRDSTLQGFTIEAEVVPENLVDFHMSQMMCAGIYCLGSSPTIDQCSFLNFQFHRGAAMELLDSSAFVKDCHFQNNKGLFGGAVYADSSNDVKIYGCSFWGNEGGAVHLKKSEVQMTSSHFKRNLDSVYSGSCITCTDGSNVKFSKGSLIANQGNAIMAIYVESNSEMVLKDSLVYGNTSGSATVCNSSLTILNSKLGPGSPFGGIFYFRDSSVKMVGVDILTFSDKWVEAYRGDIDVTGLTVNGEKKIGYFAPFQMYLQ